MTKSTTPNIAEGGYAEQQPKSKSEAQIPPPAKPPESLDGGAAIKSEEPNTLPDQASEDVTRKRPAPAKG